MSDTCHPSRCHVENTNETNDGPCCAADCIDGGFAGSGACCWKWMDNGGGRGKGIGGGTAGRTQCGGKTKRGSSSGDGGRHRNPPPDIPCTPSREGTNRAKPLWRSSADEDPCDPLDWTPQKTFKSQKLGGGSAARYVYDNSQVTVVGPRNTTEPPGVSKRSSSSNQRDSPCKLAPKVGEEASAQKMGTTSISPL
jgi:hypothetical protein